MLTITARQRRDRQTDRIYRRVTSDDLLTRAEFLPELDRLLLHQLYSQGNTLRTLARLQRSTPDKLSRRLRCIKARLADPCFLLTTRFAEKLPAHFRPIAHSYFIDHLTLRQCAARHHTTLHQIRCAITAVRSLLVYARPSLTTLCADEGDT